VRCVIERTDKNMRKLQVGRVTLIVLDDGTFSHDKPCTKGLRRKKLHSP